MRKKLQLRDRGNFRLKKKRKYRRVRSKLKLRLKRLGLDSEGKARRISIAVPKVLSLQHKLGRKVTLRFITKVRDRVNRSSVNLDFSDTLVLYPTGTLLLTAELDRLHRSGKTRFDVSITWSKNAIVNQVLRQVGIAALCGLEAPCDDEELDESVRHWRYATGERMNDAPGRALERFEGRLSDELQSGMWKGVSEAVVNSVQHAYLAPRNDGSTCAEEIRWWMFSEVREGKLTVAVCDLGIGIPRSLPMVWGEGRIAKLLLRFGVVKPDLSAVKAALEIGATRTGEENRGRGLPQIWQEMKAHGAARVVLLSNRALLSWNGIEQSERQLEFEDSIFGTMVVWTVPLSDDYDGR